MADARRLGARKLTAKERRWFLGHSLLLVATSFFRRLSAQGLVDRIIATVREFTRGAAQSDDITVMVIRYLGAGA